MWIYGQLNWNPCPSLLLLYITASWYPVLSNKLLEFNLKMSSMFMERIVQWSDVGRQTPSACSRSRYICMDPATGEIGRPFVFLNITVSCHSNKRLRESYSDTHKLQDEHLRASGEHSRSNVRNQTVCRLACEAHDSACIFRRHNAHWH